MTSADRREVGYPELVELLDVSQVRFIEISAARLETPRGDDEYSLEPDLTLKPAFSTDGEALRVQARAEVETGHLDMTIVFEVFYSCSEPLHFAGDDMHKFLSRSTILTVAPFIREAMATTAARFEVPVPVLGLVRAGFAGENGLDEA